MDWCGLVRWIRSSLDGGKRGEENAYSLAGKKGLTFLSPDRGQIRPMHKKKEEKRKRF